MTKYFWLSCFFIAQVTIFLIYYCTGAHGIIAYHLLQQQYASAQEAVKKKTKEIDEIRVLVHAYETDSFYTEKTAREQLCMGYPGESVFIYK